MLATEIIAAMNSVVLFIFFFIFKLIFEFRCYKVITETAFAPNFFGIIF